LTFIVGNVLGMKEVSALKLLDVYFPQTMLEQYDGPSFTLDNMRKYLNIYDRPILGTIIKPKIGLTAAEYAEVCYDFWSGGGDFVKNDEPQADQDFCQYDKMVKYVKEAMLGDKMTVKQLLSIENIEQRMAALRIFGADRLIDEAKATLVSSSKRGNNLYVIPKETGLFTMDAYFLRYSCPSTGRVYVSGVAPELFDSSMTRLLTLGDRFNISPDFISSDLRNNRRRFASVESKYNKDYPREVWADLAMSWKHRLSLEEYQQLIPENEA
jgi:hypothetical protein